MGLAGGRSGIRRDDYETAVFYPEDERFLVQRDLTTAHYEVDTHVGPDVA
jgi:hypothetical protein